MFSDIYDSHTHSDNSQDGNHSVIYLCEQAIQNGVKGFALTDHCECNLFSQQAFRSRIRQSLFDAARARELFVDELQVSLGVELGQPTQNLEAAGEVLSLGHYDFILASLHNSTGMDDAYYVDFSDRDLNIHDFLDAYFKEYVQLARWNQFDSVAHITYPLRYICGKYGHKVDTAPYGEYVDELFRMLIQNGKALELNTSGLRQPYGLTMPTLDYFKRYRELGGELVTIGSDAHFAQHVGAGIREGIELLKEAGFTYYAFYQKREPQLIKLV